MIEDETSRDALFTVEICIASLAVLTAGELLDFSNLLFFRSEAARVVSLALRVFGISVTMGTLARYVFRSTKRCFRKAREGAEISALHCNHE